MSLELNAGTIPCLGQKFVVPGPSGALETALDPLYRPIDAESSSRVYQAD